MAGAAVPAPAPVTLALAGWDRLTGEEAGPG